MSPNLLNVRRKSRECEKKWQQTFSFDFLLWPSTSFLTFWLSFSRLDPVLTHRQRPVLWPVNSMHWTIMQLIRGVQQFYLYPVFGHQQETCWPHEVYNRGHKRYRLALRRCFACYKNNNDMRMVRIAIMMMTRNLQRVVVVVVWIAIKTSKALWLWCRNWCNKVPSGGRPGWTSRKRSQPGSSS